MIKYKDVDPKVKRLFPWALFLVLTALLLVGSCSFAHGESDVYACYGSGRYEAMQRGWPACNEMCGKLKAYLQGHSEAEARAKAAEMHLPKWIIRKAEACL